MSYSPTLKRLRISLQGLLQGIGFRPYIYQLANDIGLTGWVQNSPQGVTIEVEGGDESLEKFLQLLDQNSPPDSVFQIVDSAYLEPSGYQGFEIKKSDLSGDQTVTISPDIATCEDCLKELFSPSNRRYLYPFINCTHCGPRFSIIDTLPYDRPHTSMKMFQMCAACKNEYDNPENRRFHAQPNACPDCGPQLELWDSDGSPLKVNVIDKAVEVLQKNAILAVKGIGGFHLMVNALNDPAVDRLRNRKHREEKPFALMFPDLQSVEGVCRISDLEKQLLLSPQAPIVLLRRNSGGEPAISSRVAPFNPYLGIMLPSNPLHHILMDRLNAPVVATSGNISNETICTCETEAVNRLRGIADYFLIHNRPIIRHADDSIVRETLGSGQILRRARGYAPLPITVKEKMAPMVAVGGFLKNTVAISKDKNIFLSQHIGDLGNPQTESAFEGTLKSLTKVYGLKKVTHVCDAHPDYPSTRFAERNENIPVQHHVAHVFSCMAEHDLEGPLLGIAWDGSGYGLDGTVWGGEFFHVTSKSVSRVACWRPFPLPGGEAAIKEPRRSSLGLLYEVLGEAAFDQFEIKKSFSSEELTVLKNMIQKNINCPPTSSSGRLFDAVASLTGIRQTISYEGQAAMEVEFLAEKNLTESFYPVKLIEQRQVKSNPATRKKHCDLNLKYLLDETLLVQELLGDISEKRAMSLIAAKFHNTLTETVLSVAKRVGERKVVLSGGCFQNKFLTESTVDRLRKEGFQPYWHQRVPPNDGGLALGQIYAANWFLNKKEVPDVPGNTR